MFKPSKATTYEKAEPKKWLSEDDCRAATACKDKKSTGNKFMNPLNMHKSRKDK